MEIHAPALHPVDGLWNLLIPGHVYISFTGCGKGMRLKWGAEMKTSTGET